jgi:hypothetical protein
VWLVALVGCGRVGFDPVNDAASVSADAFASDLIAYFPLDGDLQDALGGPAGTCTSCPTPVPGHLGMAMHFDGNTTCVAISDIGQFSPAQITVAIWANSDALKSNECQVSKRVDVTGNVDNSWQLETIAMPDQESFTSNHGDPANWYNSSPPNTMKAGVWQHLVGTYDGSTVALYIDGVLELSSSQPNPIAYDSHPAWLGCDDNAGLGEAYGGALDELRIYNRALSQAEIQALP